MAVHRGSLTAGLLLLVCCAASALADQGRLYVYRSPAHHHYDTASTDPLRMSEVENLLASVNGFSIQSPIRWSGLKSSSAHLTPRATLVFLVDSGKIKAAEDVFGSKSVPIEEDDTVNFQHMHNYYDAKYHTNGLVRTFEKLPTDLKNDLEKDLATKCAPTDSAVFYVFKVCDADLANLKESVEKITQVFDSQCATDRTNDLLVLALATSHAQRIKRAAEQAQSAMLSAVEVNGTVLNQAEFYSVQYPPMFNILFFVSLFLALAVFGISYGMLGMDPGLDTVIYRMTSQRIKKDQ